MPKLTIDGREIEFAPGATVIEAAAAAGITIPHYCWHPGLSVAGNCRMCLVEIEKMPKLMIACATKAAPDMVVTTNNERVRKAREAIEEFLLINHPLDCPICDQAGECRLQEYSYRYGTSASRFVEQKVHKPKKVDIGPHIVFDAERCILCSRCVRFCQEVSKTAELTIAERSDHAIIETFPGRALDNPYSGNTVDICPVGALTLKEFRFKQRVWFLKNTDSVCPGCARGCSIVAGVGRDRILRYVPRLNPAVNGWWMCDEGRLSYQKLQAGIRIPQPAGRGTGPLTWAAAVEEAAARLRRARERHGPAAVAILASPRMTNEDLHVLSLLAGRALPGAPIFLARHERGEDDAILIRRDKSPNSRGAREILGQARPAEDLPAEIRSGKVAALLMAGHTMTGMEDDTPLAEEDLRAVEALVLVDSFETAASGAAAVVLPALAFGEHEGTFTNFTGQVQRVRAALPPQADAWPAWRILQEIGARLAGTEMPRFAGAQAVFKSLAGSAPPYAGLSYARLGEQGAPLGPGTP